MKIDNSLLAISGSLCILAAIILGGIISSIKYLKSAYLRKIFPGNHFLIKSHIDYAIMGALVFATYASVKQLNINLPIATILAITAGSLYNPFGFFILAIKPDLAETDTVFSKIRVLIGFLPATYGFASVSIEIISSIIIN